MTSREFYEILDGSEFGREYLKLIDKAVSRKYAPSGRVEKHHIHPKALGGSRKSETNIVILTVFEHCLAHVFLARAIPCPATLKPIVRMNTQFNLLSNPDKITLEDVYKWSLLREQAIHSHHSPEHSAAISRARKGQECNNKNTVWMHTDERNIRIPKSEVTQKLEEGWILGRNEKTRQSICKGREGQPGTRLGTHQSPKTIAKIKKLKSGQVWVTDGVSIRSIPKGPEQNLILQQYLQQGWSRGRTLRRKS